jgi:hypothetical protein
MRNSLLFSIVLLLSCNSKHSDYRPAEDALDAGREYINACLQGDFSKAAFYAVPDEKNIALIKELERTYRENDKEGRQQLRTASINISEVKDLSDTGTLIHYNNSFDKQPHTLQVVKRNNTWLVDLNKN